MQSNNPAMISRDLSTLGNERRSRGAGQKTRVQFTAMHIPIETFRLPNGLFVTLSEDHTAPIVAVNLWYHVGSANEHPGRTGFAHLFEHMLFQGSADVAANEHFELIQRAGGTLNGSTWLDRTNYFETVPSNQLELALWLEANRMGYLLPAMTQQKLDTQRDVVQNERRWSMDNQPYGTWWEKLPALTFPAEHPFHHSLIGSMADLDAASLEDISHFFATYYTPDNAVLSITGDFDPTDAQRLVEKHFGQIPAGRGKPPLPDMSLPRTFGEWRREIIPDDVVLPRLFLAFRGPVFGTVDHYAASVAAAVLGLRKGSRLHRALVRERQVASEAQAFTYDLTKGADLLVVDVTARPSVSAEQLEGEVAREVDAFSEQGATDAEVKRAVALIQTDIVRSLQSAAERADRLSLFATYFGNPALVNEEMDRYRAVTASDVSAFAREYLGRDNRASLVYVPRDLVRGPQSAVREETSEAVEASA
jgi:zinc protease